MQTGWEELSYVVWLTLTYRPAVLHRMFIGIRLCVWSTLDVTVCLSV